MTAAIGYMILTRLMFYILLNIAESPQHVWDYTYRGKSFHNKSDVGLRIQALWSANRSDSWAS